MAHLSFQQASGVHFHTATKRDLLSMSTTTDLCTGSRSHSSQTCSKESSPRDVLVHHFNDSIRFVEYCQRNSQDDASNSATLEAWAAKVAPNACSRVVKRLSLDLPLPEQLKHLKRVRKRRQPATTKTEATPIETDTQPTKRPKLEASNAQDDNLSTSSKPIPPDLEILVGPLDAASQLDPALAELLGPLHKVQVPRRAPQSQEESNQANQIWPTQFFPLKSDEYKNQQLSLEQSELANMHQTMQKVLETGVCLVIDPATQKVVSRSSDELDKQSADFVLGNPLSSPILLAIQGVSRAERLMELTTQRQVTRKGQYLCTGYDLFACYSPSIFEAMSCLHSRVRRVVFPKESVSKQAWPDGLQKHRIHCLPGTNHRFRALEYHCETSTELNRDQIK
eukprot:Nitzschia sp. Nitz4//scaffold49_size126201//63948//65132//NITZ4_003645-RA/size126201-processed-gene-0.142-mRNA-1//1//CDS//3329553158//8149//frame0